MVQSRLSDFPISFPKTSCNYVKLTQPIVNGLTLPSGKADAIFFDDDVPGFGLRLRAGGKRSWIFQYQIGTKQRRMSLGTVPALTLTAARKTAAELHARVKLAEDPAAAKRESQRRANDTVEAMRPWSDDCTVASSSFHTHSQFSHSST